MLDLPRVTPETPEPRVISEPIVTPDDLPRVIPEPIVTPDDLPRVIPESIVIPYNLPRVNPELPDKLFIIPQDPRHAVDIVIEILRPQEDPAYKENFLTLMGKIVGGEQPYHELSQNFMRAYCREFRDSHILSLAELRQLQIVKKMVCQYAHIIVKNPQGLIEDMQQVEVTLQQSIKFFEHIEQIVLSLPA